MYGHLINKSFQIIKSYLKKYKSNKMTQNNTIAMNNYLHFERQDLAQRKELEKAIIFAPFFSIIINQGRILYS